MVTFYYGNYFMRSYHRMFHRFTDPKVHFGPSCFDFQTLQKIRYILSKKNNRGDILLRCNGCKNHAIIKNFIWRNKLLFNYFFISYFSMHPLLIRTQCASFIWNLPKSISSMIDAFELDVVTIEVMYIFQSK